MLLRLMCSRRQIFTFVGAAVSSRTVDLASFPTPSARWVNAGADLMVNTVEPGGARPRHGRLVPAPEVVLDMDRAGAPEVDVELQGGSVPKKLVSAAGHAVASPPEVIQRHPPV